MSRPRRYPDTGVFYFRSRLPADPVKLITTAVREMARDPKVGRAEALRR